MRHKALIASMALGIFLWATGGLAQLDSDVGCRGYLAIVYRTDPDTDKPVFKENGQIHIKAFIMEYPYLNPAMYRDRILCELTGLEMIEIMSIPKYVRLPGGVS